MRSYPISAMTAVAAAAAVLTGCSSGSGDQPSTSSVSAPSSSPGPAATTTSTTLATHTAAPGGVGITRGGVTTAVGAPAESTEDEYFQACQAAKTWMTQRGGDLKAQFEPYLQSLQSTGSVGPGTFGKPWAEQSAGRQAAIIVAAEAASDSLCG